MSLPSLYVEQTNEREKGDRFKHWERGMSMFTDQGTDEEKTEKEQLDLGGKPNSDGIPDVKWKVSRKAWSIMSNVAERSNKMTNTI